jgi:hypothetical protein
MGRDTINSAGFAITIEGPGAIGFTLCLGLGTPQGAAQPFHDPSPLMTLGEADHLWVACDSDPVSVVAAKAAMSTAVRVWFDNLPTAIDIGGMVYNLKERALQAVRISHRPLAPRLTNGGLPSVV